MITSLFTCRFFAFVAIGALLAAIGIKGAAPGGAVTLDRVIETIREADGHYARSGATLRAADCSGLVSVAQSLAMGKPVARLGNTDSLLAGRWPNAIAGAKPGDRFIVATNPGHMVAQLDGVGIEATCCGQPFRIGPTATSVWDSRFTSRFHIDPKVLIA